MAKIEAKVIVKDKYWILRRDKTKVGQVTREGAGYEVRINGRSAGRFNNIKELQESKMFKFVDLPQPEVSASKEVHGYETDTLPYNAMWNIQYGLPLYTKTADSRSWYAAGWYRINIKGSKDFHFCPKLIMLQRNDYEGPFESKASVFDPKLFDEAT